MSRQVRLVLALLLLGAALLFGGCGPDLPPSDDDPDAGGMMMECEPPRQMCGSRCVNVESDPDNCGSCGTVCPGGSFCSEGSCGMSCGGSLIECGASCADPSRDPDHCGGCDRPCDSDEVCEGGACQCSDGKTDCSGECVDTDTDSDNCGICGRACDPGETCEAGSCTGGGMDDAGMEMDGGSGCPSDMHMCPGGCEADMANEPENGCRLGCGAACPEPDHATATCTSSGMCDFECDSPWTRSGDVCECTGSGCPGTCSPDSAEPNETQSGAYAFADFTDSPDTSMSFASFNLDDGSDTDWYRFMVSDDGFDGNPVIDVTLDRIPTGSDYELGVWFLCDAAGTTGATCRMGLSDSLGVYEGCTSTASGHADERIELATECSGTDESGIVLVRVESFSWGGSCDDYRLIVDVY